MQFHPLAYLLKLQIEMGMADLIVKIVRAANPEVGSSEPYPKYGGTTAAARTPANNLQASKIHTWQGRQHETQIEVGDEADCLEMEMYAQAIKKTVVTEVVTVDKDQPQQQRQGQRGRQQGRHNGRWSKSDPVDDEMTSSSSSTRELKDGRRDSLV